jgi:chorismate mutase/prephenate dehydratase
MVSRIAVGVVALIAVMPGVAAAQSPAEPKMAEYRTQIDDIDRQIVDLLNRRAAIVERVGNLKKEAGLPVAVPAREQQVLDRVVEAGKKGPLPPATLRRIYGVILEEMRTWESLGSPRR